MKRKSTIVLIIATFIVASLSIVGCKNVSRNGTVNDAGNNATNNIQNTIDSPNPYTRNAADTARDTVDTAEDSLRYTAQNFRDDITNAGYAVTDLANNTKNYFSGKETDYNLGGEVIRLYEYNSATDLEGDINRIAPNGMTINGTNANYETKPYYYRKGNTLIVYEGKEPRFIDQLNNVYGKTLRP